MPSPSPPTSSSSSSSPYPFAAAPDIIRAHQKDAYFTGTLTNTLADLHRRLLGARSAHAWATEARATADLLYFGLTTLVGNRTLGEEYTDVVQVDASDGRLPALASRATYIAGSVLLPYLLGKGLPGFRARLRSILERRIRELDARIGEKKQGAGREKKIWTYVLNHLGTLTSGAPIHAITLAMFYFSGTYYELAKRILGLRYVFTRKVADTPDRAGYEVLGVLLVIQMGVQAYLHIRATITAHLEERQRERLGVFNDTDLSLSENAYSDNNAVLLAGGPPVGSVNQPNHLDIAKATNTPVLTGPRYDLQDGGIMRFIAGKQQRKCTLCLEEMRDPSATQCGHVFCWTCIGDWVREKPECPLCRREAMIQHILPLRMAA